MKWKMSIRRILGISLILSCFVTGAVAECPIDTSDNLGKPRTDIEEGRSDTLTAPLVTWEEYVGRSSECNQNDDGSSAEEEATDSPPIIIPEPTQPNPTQGVKPTAAPTEPPKQEDDTTGSHYTPGSLSSQERYLLESINADRAKNGLGALEVDMELTQLARMKSTDMIDERYFAHESPNYGRAADMLKDAGYKHTSVAENIARSGSVEKAHAALMSSSGHRRNILGSQWKKVGIGVVNDANGYPYVTELFVR